MTDSPNTETAIADKLKKYRRINGLSQEGLAETSGISIRTIQRIENGLSVGSAFTLQKLTTALHIQIEDLLPPETLKPIAHYSNTTHLKLLNLSAIAAVFIPLANIILPAIIYRKYKNDEAIILYGRKIISVQILWTLITILMMLLIPVVLLSLFTPLRGSKIPLFALVYFISVICNVCLVIRFAIGLNNKPGYLEKLPNLL